MIATRDKEQSYRTVPDGTYYYAMTIILGDFHRVMPWDQFLGAEGTDREILITFRLFDVTIKGSGLIQLLRDAKRHKIDILTVAPRHQALMGGEGVVVTHIDVKEAKP